MIVTFTGLKGPIPFGLEDLENMKRFRGYILVGHPGGFSIFKKLPAPDLEIIPDQRVFQLNQNSDESPIVAVPSIACSEVKGIIAFLMVNDGIQILDSHFNEKHLIGGEDATKIALSPDGKTLVIGDRKGRVCFYDLTTKKRLLCRKLGNDTITALCYSPCGKFLFVGSGEKLFSWNLRHEYPTFVRRHDGNIISIVIKNSTVRTKTISSNVREFNFDKDRHFDLPLTVDVKKVWQKCLSPYFSEITATVFSRDGKFLAVGLEDGSLVLINMESRTSIAQFPGKDEITAIDFSPDGEKVAVGTIGGKIRVYDILHRFLLGQPITQVKSESMGVRINTVTFSPDGNKIVIGTSGTITILEEKKKPVKLNYDGSVISISFSPNGELLLAGINNNDNNKVIVIDFKAKKQILVIEIENTIGTVLFSPDGKKIAVGIQDGLGYITIYSANTGKVLRVLDDQFRFYDRDYLDMQYSPDGKNIVAIFDAHLVVFDTNTEEVIYTDHSRWHNLTDNPRTICFSPDGKHILLGNCVGFVSLHSFSPLVSRKRNSRKRKTRVTDFSNPNNKK